MKKISERLIILRTLKHSEADLIIHALSAKRGRINLIAKGALKSKRRFVGGVLEPTHFIEASIALKPESREGALHFLEEAQLLQGFEKIRSDYDKLNLAFYFLQVISKVAQEEDPESQKLFDLLGNSLKALEASSRLDLLKTLFEIKVLLIQGVIPEDLPNVDLFQFSMKEHEKAKVDGEDFRRLKHQVQAALRGYLGGASLG
jgi:DNA repair protein RecO (recombination protein O)